MIGYVSFYTDTSADALVFSDNANGMILTAWKVSPPKPRINMVTVPGRHGAIDYTGFYGDAVMDNAKISMTFALKDDSNLITANRNIVGNIHGKELYFRSSKNQSGRYYHGRCYVSTWQRKGGVVYYTITAEVEPFMLGSVVESSFNPESGASSETPKYVDIPSSGDYKAPCSLNVASGSNACHLCDENGNDFEYIASGYIRKVSALTAGARNYYSSGTGTINYSHHPLYHIELGV